MAKTYNWEPENVGAFINLNALSRCQDLTTPGARLPDWKTIQDRYPELIDRSAAPYRLFVSHRWDDKEHPDPTGWQLEALIQLACHYSYNKPNICIWYDYMSLPQKPRSASEEAIFKAGLSNIRHIVGECPNVFLVSESANDHRGDLDAQLLRGWIVFELYISRGAMKSQLPLFQRETSRINFGRQHAGLDVIVSNIHSSAPWEDARQLETWFRRRDIKCTNDSDLGFLAGLLTESLKSHKFDGRMPDIKLGSPIQLSEDEIREFAFLKECGLSPRRPDLFLTDVAYDALTRTWTVVIQPRPPALPLSQWIDVKVEDIESRKIDPKNGRSPMYPGILFEFSPDGRRICPTIP